MPVLTVRLSPSLHELFVKECEKRGTTTSELLREAIETFVDRASEPPERRVVRQMLTASVADLEARGAVTRASKLTMDDMRPPIVPGSLLKKPKGAK